MIIAPRGTKDVLPNEAYKWHYVEKIMREVADDFGYKEVRTPTFEFTELFTRGVGDTTDIVQKEMYTFEDKGGRSITLKPEGTAGAVRALLENKLYSEVQPTKVYYISPIFRYDKPQKGRYREHHQFGIEAFGSKNPTIDAEIIGLAMELYRRLNITNLEVHINSIGCPECRKAYQQKLKDYIGQNINNLCETCKTRFEKNPMRVLDCKEKNCKDITTDAPTTIDFLCTECSEHFEQLQEILKSVGISYKIDPKIVRGLDYYTKTVFEIISNEIGAQGTVCGGGRYDGLVEELGGNPTPGIGFGMGIERLLLSLENNNVEIPMPSSIDVFLVSLGDKAKKIIPKMLTNLRNNKISSDMDHMDRSLKAQMKYADKLGAKFTIVLGDEEVENGNVTIKDMRTGDKHNTSLDKIIEKLKELI